MKKCNHKTSLWEPRTYEHFPQLSLVKCTHVENLDQQVEKMLSSKEYKSGCPLRWKVKHKMLQHLTKQDQALFIYKLTEDTFIKVIIFIHSSNGKSGNTVCVKL